MRWLWIDRIVQLDTGRRCVAVKNVSLAEEVLHDHFRAIPAAGDAPAQPALPVMPNTLILEGMAQTAGILVGHARDFKEKVILAKIGKAVFDEDLCLPYAESEPCIVCEEHCPIPEKAIKLTQVGVEVDSDDGPSTIVLQQPSVDEELCIGCGICEHVCPLEGLAGVRIESLRDEAARE
jgi:ferredoxin